MVRKLIEKITQGLAKNQKLKQSNINYTQIFNIVQSNQNSLKKKIQKKSGGTSRMINQAWEQGISMLKRQYNLSTTTKYAQRTRRREDTQRGIQSYNIQQLQQQLQQQYIMRTYQTTNNRENESDEHKYSYYQIEDEEEYVPKRSKNNQIFHQKVMLGMVIVVILSFIYDIIANFKVYQQKLYKIIQSHESAMMNESGYFLEYQRKEEVTKPTLVINPLIFFHHEYSVKKGSSYRMRPDTKSFIEKLSELYEIVLFFDDYQAGIQQIFLGMRSMFMSVMFAPPLSRENTDWDNGWMTKDMKKLGRDPDSILHLDCRKEAFGRTPEYGIYVTPYEGKEGDTELKDMYPLIANLAIEWQESLEKSMKANVDPNELFDFRKRLRHLGNQGRVEKDELGRLKKIEGIAHFSTIKDKYFSEMEKEEEEQQQSSSGWFSWLS